jgi:hypothetical protein
MSTDDVGEFVERLIAAEEARVEKVRAEMFAHDTCRTCGVLVVDQVQHMKFHHALNECIESFGRTLKMLVRNTSHRQGDTA